MNSMTRRALLAGGLSAGIGGMTFPGAIPMARSGETGMEEFKRLRLAKYVNAVAWNEDGSRLASLSGFGHTITIWDTRIWSVVNQFDRYSGGYSFNSLCYLSDGTLLTSAPEGKSPDPQYETLSIFSLILWNPDTGKSIRYIPDPLPTTPFSIRPTDTFVASPDGTLVAGIMEGSRDGRVLLFDTRGWEMIHSFVSPPTPLHPDGAWCVTFSPDSKEIAIGTVSGFVHVFRLTSMTPQLSFQAYPNDLGCNAIAFDPDGKAVATGRGNVTLYTRDKDLVRLWNASDGKHILSLEGGTGNVNSLSYSRDSLLCAGYDRTLRVWNASMNPAMPLLETGQDTYCVAFSPAGVLAAAHRNVVALYQR